jgi:hypothetical protein
MDSKTDHVWHVWINAESDRLREWQKANPSGEVATETRRGRQVETPVPQRTPLDLIDPHGRGLYSFKSAMQTLPWLTRVIGMERQRTLPLVHQQCSHSPPEPIKEEFLTCSFGKKLRECPILQRLRDSISDQQQNAYYRSIEPERVDELQAMTCVWHMLMGHDGFVDWNEGAVQTVSDRMFWDRVYESLSTPLEEPK